MVKLNARVISFSSAFIYIVCDLTVLKNSGKKLISQLHPNQNKDEKIANSVLLSLFMGDNKISNISQLPLCTS